MAEVNISTHYPGDHNTSEIVLVVVTSIFAAFMWLFFFNRVYVKLWLLRRVSWDDATITLATIMATIYYFALMYSVSRHTIGLSPALWTWPQYLTWVLSRPIFLFLKATFFIMYLELFGRLRWVRFASWTGLFVSTVLHLVYSVWSFAVANPRSGAYFVKATKTIGIPSAAFGLVIDVWLFAIPAVAIWGLNMEAGKKWKLNVMFMGGVFGVICSAASMYFRVDANRIAGAWRGLPAFICAVCEMCVGVICACLPAASCAAKDPNSIYNILSRKSRNLVSVDATPKGSQNTGDSSLGFTRSETGGVRRSTDRKYAQYFELEDCNASGKQAPDSPGKVTYGTEKAGDLESGIMKQVQIEIESRPAMGGTGTGGQQGY
ncbi:hypothetical protein BDV95DRAFT_605345 [Massariosphaeria phaeospora]|uniref:Rhodopsin domain-containing protein n=1 Tax=Massariosphaeria phaeospora TaxID=100035 RepID=A0A7C8MBA8_9PLEO|nr:hypothetical protein BDV95DRAFT_605345 [Massariosphaeria phaeospora]